MKKRKIRPLHDVFKMIDMHGGDKRVCWEWQGALSPNPIFCWGGKRLQARRVVFALRHNIPLAKVPQLVMSCDNARCCSPYHIVDRYGIVEKINGSLRRGSR